jgi:hypothetical protein
MNHALDVTTAENGSDFDPQQAAAANGAGRGNRQQRLGAVRA